jgi:hypothetical protein
MSSLAHTDLAGLADLAQRRDREIRPLLLRMHTRAFASATVRDGRLLATFEAIASGLIPLVDDDVVDEVESALRSVPDVPSAIRSLLDRHSARARQTALGARAARYRSEAAPGREEIRAALALEPGLADTPLPPLSAARRLRMLKAAATGDLAGVLAEIGRALKLPETPDWRLDRPADAELFALSLVAAGLEENDRARVLLTVDEALARSVRAVFGLTRLCRTVPRAVAAELVRAVAGMPRPAEGAAKPARTERGSARDPKPPRTRRDGASATARTAPAPDPAASGPAGRRSRSTTGPDRS